MTTLLLWTALGARVVAAAPAGSAPAGGAPAGNAPVDTSQQWQGILGIDVDPSLTQPSFETPPAPAAPKGAVDPAVVPTPTPTPTPAPIQTPVPGPVDLIDPLGPVEAMLDGLQSQPGVHVGYRMRSADALRGETLTVDITGAPGDLLQYVLEAVAPDGYLLLLEPVAAGRFQLIALQARTGRDQGVALILAKDPAIDGEFRRGENRETLAQLVAAPAGGVLDLDVIRDLERLGYRATFRATGAGTIALSVRVGRAIRRVKVHGHIPLSERTVRRVLSLDARPGALARGVCSAQARFNRERPEPCGSGDLACAAWRDAELKRLRRYLFDEGYLRGDARLGLQCGRDGTSSGRRSRAQQEVTLHVYLDKGAAHRVGPMAVTGNLSTQDQRWIRRVFRPTVGPFIPLPKRVTRRHIEQARERVAREYAEPRTGAGKGTRRQLELPYPGVRVQTNFDTMDPAQLPPGRTVPLAIDVQLGQGVQTDFTGNDRLSDARLRGELQLWGRREPASKSTVAREAENLRVYYQSRGYLLARVSGSLTRRGTLEKLSFEIHEGPKVRVGKVTLVRPSHVPEPVMDFIADTWRAERQVTARSAFIDNEARGDLATVLAAFNERGYLCATAQIRVAFWPSGLDEIGAYAILDPASALDAPGAPSWLSRGMDAGGLQQLSKNQRARLYVRIEVVPGPRVVTSGRELVRHLEEPIPPTREVGNVPVAATGQWGAPRMLRDGPLRRSGDKRAGGIPLHLTLARETARDIVRRYRTSGYPVADVELRWVYKAPDEAIAASSAKRLTDPAVGLCRRHAGDTTAIVDTEISVYEGPRGTFGTMLVRGNFKTRDRLILRERPWEEGAAYDASAVDSLRQRIEGIGVTESLSIGEHHVGCGYDDEGPCVVHDVVEMTESKDRSIDLAWGFGTATLDPAYVFIRPTFPNFGGFGWDLSLEGHFGANLAPLRRIACEGEDCYERSARATLSHRRIFGLDPTAEISGQLQRRVTPARGQIDSALGQARLSWPFVFDRSRRRARAARRERTRIYDDDVRVYAGYLIQVANISKDLAKTTLGAAETCGTKEKEDCRPPNRGEAIIPDITAGGIAGIVWERVDNPFNPSHGIVASVDGLLASPWVGGTDWWIRGQADLRQYVPIPRTNERLNFRYSLSYAHAIALPDLAGSSATSIPEVWRFFGGGTADLGLRGIDPQTMLLDVEAVRGAFGAVTLRPTAQGGHIRALATVALQVVSVRNFLGGNLAHSLFIDTGVLTQTWSQVRPARDIRRSIGVNAIKWDISIVTVALGYAVLIPDRVIPGGNVGPTDDRNGRFVFDVGATF